MFRIGPGQVSWVLRRFSCFSLTLLLNSPPTRTTSIPPLTTPTPTPTNLDYLSPAPLLVSRLFFIAISNRIIPHDKDQWRQSSHLCAPGSGFLISALRRLRIPPRRRQPTPRPLDRPYGRYTLPLIGTKSNQAAHEAFTRRVTPHGRVCRRIRMQREMVDLE
ncbi:hypothetical protein C8J56DRAFT_249863 [Mycena floridula]|nr:hypothetical protein C8J56DRAFT_249863 [Mycena floridula]